MCKGHFGILVLAVVQICAGRIPISPSGCPLECPATFEPLCGSDGITYDNECELELADCIKPPIHKASDGDCGGPLATTCPTSCPATLKHVCGSDGKTYDNDCELKLAICQNRRIHKIAEGACEGLNNKSCSGKCSQLYKPVCGSDNITYTNECELDLASCKESSIYKLADGKCEVGPPKCVLFCENIYNPVCGSDANTYNNECELNRTTCYDPSIFKISNGACDVSGEDCVSDCAEVFQPVCGSDGVIYDNDCRLRQATCRNSSLFKISDGECDSGRQECIWLCNDKYEPICGSDGLTYTNQCELDYANCKDASITGVFQGGCEEFTTEPTGGDITSLSSFSQNEVVTESSDEPTTLSYHSDDEDTVE